MDHGPRAALSTGSNWVNANAENQQNFSWNVLQGVSAIPGTSNYWGVGVSLNEPEAVPYTLIERWTPNSWTVLPHPFGGWLNGVSAIGPKNAWAVGFEQPSSNELPLALRWNGAQWKSIPVPAPKGANVTTLQSVAIDGSNHAFAVGWSQAQGSFGVAPLIEHWNGKQWTVDPTPPVGNHSLLNSISHIAGTNITWAAGKNGDSNSETSSALFEMFDGSSWQLIPPAPNANKVVTIYSISAVTPADVWAAGSQEANSSSLSVPLLEHWNGKAWKIVDSVNPNPYADSALWGIAGIRGVRESFSVGTTGGPDYTFSESCR